MCGQEHVSALSCPAHSKPQVNQMRFSLPPERLESMPIRIFVADDHDIVREGVKSLLKSRPDWTICGEASDGIQAESRIEKVDCDIAVLDISMPGKSGLEVAAAVSRKHPEIKILIFTMHSGKTLSRRRPRGRRARRGAKIVCFPRSHSSDRGADRRGQLLSGRFNSVLRCIPAVKFQLCFFSYAGF